ncbi:hypothetical protein GCM10027299_42530 [Larkinella ripae]
MTTEKDERGELIRVCGDLVNFVWNDESQQWNIRSGADLLALVSLPGYHLKIDKAKVNQAQEQEIRSLTGFISNHVPT